jgi:hypothetical protein
MAQTKRTATMRHQEILGHRRLTETERRDKPPAAVDRWCNCHLLYAFVRPARDDDNDRREDSHFSRTPRRMVISPLLGVPAINSVRSY